MIRLIALIISITIQFLAAYLSLRLMRLTKFRISWIMISLGLVFMAFRQLITLIQWLNDDISLELLYLNDWLGVAIALVFIVGVIYIREIFYSLNRADLDRKRSERKVLNAIINTEEKERQRFAKDLHDGLGPLLSTVKMSMSALAGMKQDEQSLKIIRNTQLITDEAINSIKDISNNLSPHILTSFGVETALKNFINKIKLVSKVKIDFYSDIGEIRLPADTEIVVYRSVCELISNTIKHALAKKIRIEIIRAEELLTLTYNDDGIGFNMEKINREEFRGMGLSNIRTRINSINGTFHYESAIDGGFHAQISIPLPKLYL
jgi:signal transduction histidine kinase